MTIRKLSKDDKKELTSLVEEFYKKFYREGIFADSAILDFSFVGSTNLDEVIERDVKEMFEDPLYIVFVAEEKNKLVGYISGKIIDKPGRKFNKEGFIDAWYVKDGYRRKHVGSQLYESLVEEFKKNKCDYLSVEAFSNNKDVIDLYHKLGFQDIDVKLRKRLEKRG